MPLHFRRAAPSDVEQTVGLIGLARVWQDSVGQPAAFRTDRRAEVAESIDRGATFLGLTGGEIVVATFAVESEDADVWPELAANQARFLHRLVVHPSWHRHGFGMACLSFAEDLAQAQGCDYLGLDSVRDNTSLCDWYARRGYEQAGEVLLPHWTRASMRYRKRLRSPANAEEAQ